MRLTHQYAHSLMLPKQTVCNLLIMLTQILVSRQIRWCCVRLR